MIQSMTGFGESQLETDAQVFTVEIKTLNSRYADIQVRMPTCYRKREPAVRNFLSQSLRRGKIAFSLVVARVDAKKPQPINTANVQAYMDELQALVPVLDPAEALAIAMRLPDTLSVVAGSADEVPWRQVMQAIRMATARVIDFRREEGARLARDLQGSISSIQARLKQVEIHETDRMARIGKRLRESLARLAEKADENRFEQELIYHMERLDISEEQTRLQTHLDHFLKQLQTPESNGKTLGFISQEIGREINTLGAKANHAELQKIVVQMKAALEKAREQIPNVL
ncbi:MAG: YicC/YloC family endoribonuclease [Flavobacteriales bacterium]